MCRWLKFNKTKENFMNNQMNVKSATIKLEATAIYFRWSCDVCGETQDKDGMFSEIKVEEDEKIAICRTCLDAGVDGAIERAAKQAQRIQEYVDSLRNDYPVILRSVDQWKTGKDYDAVFKAFDSQFENGLEAQ